MTHPEDVDMDVDQPEQMPEGATLADRLADSMDAPTVLLDVLPELLQDTEDLGARAEDVVAAVRQAWLKAGARVLDLGCGKGAALLALAQAYSVVGRGIDGLSAFVDHARARANALGLDGRCEFEVADIRAFVRTFAPPDKAFDLVMMLALGDALGDPEESFSTLCRLVRPGGYLLLDDAYWGDEDAVEDEDEQGLREAYGRRDDLLAQFAAAGLQVVAEHPIDGPEAASWYEAITGKVRARAEALALMHPDLREELMAFAERQAEQLDHLEGPVTGALWLLRRP